MAAAAAYPPWVMLEHFCCNCDVEGCSSSIADTNTLVSSRTSSGYPINVSLRLAAPPEGSHVCVHLPAGVGVSYTYHGAVLAAHGDSMVVEVGSKIKNPRGDMLGTMSTDHFVYSAGDAAAEPPRPPSLSLLAPHFTCEEDQRRPKGNHLDSASTGLLCRGEGDFMVAELQMDKVRKYAALHLLRSGSGEWCAKRPVMISRNADGGECVDLASWWENHTVIPVGDQMLCWVDLYRGLLFSDDVFDESPSLWHVPLPEAPCFGLMRNVCGSVTADGGGTIKFVNAFPRCCCGGAGESKCRASRHAYAVQTWTLRMDDMTWAMDGRLDATQLWSLDGYKGIPRVELDNPVVSMDEPHAICFEVCEKHREKFGDLTTWRIMVDMKSKTLRSVFRYPEGRRSLRPLPSRISRYFNSKPEAMLINLTNRRIVDDKQHAINTVQAASPEAAILAVLQEIPSLDRYDMLRAYSILAHDNSGRRFRVLMGLPMDLRKDYVLWRSRPVKLVFCALHARLTCN